MNSNNTTRQSNGKCSSCKQLNESSRRMTCQLSSVVPHTTNLTRPDRTPPSTHLSTDGTKKQRGTWCALQVLEAAEECVCLIFLLAPAVHALMTHSRQQAGSGSMAKRRCGKPRPTKTTPHKTVKKEQRDPSRAPEDSQTGLRWENRQCTARTHGVVTGC